MSKKKLLPILGLLIILVTAVGLSYAFFQAQSSGQVTRDVRVLTYSVDTLTFSVNDNIGFEATQQNFGNGGTNLNGEATATAILTPNSKTGSATKNYYLYLNITTNGIVYSVANTNHDPELMLQVFDGNNQLVTLTGLGTQKTVGSLTGYDITGFEGVATLLNSHQISATNSTTTTENWRVVVTLVNHNFNQNDNANTLVEGTLIITEDEMEIEYAYWNSNFNSDEFEPDELPSGTGLLGTYETREALATAYSNSIANGFQDRPIYIKSTILNGSVLKHESCIYYDSHELCLGANYWSGETCEDTSCYSEANGLATRNKLKAAMESKLGITLYNSSSEARNAGNPGFYCNYDAHAADCYLDDNIYCYVSASGHVDCDVESGSACCIDGDGDAYCDL